jgi:hypothetical protein
VQLYLTLGGQVEGISRDTVRDWLTIVRRQLSDVAEEQGACLREYACTMLAVVAGQTATAFFQIGDGAIVVDDEHLRWRYVFWPQKGEFANSTNFVTQDNALDRIVFEFHGKPISELAVFTDGIESLVLRYADRAVHAPYFDRVFATLRSSTILGLDAEMSAALAAHLGSAAVCERTDDDKTLVLASRRPIADEAVRAEQTTAS